MICVNLVSRIYLLHGVILKIFVSLKMIGRQKYLTVKIFELKISNYRNKTKYSFNYSHSAIMPVFKT